MFKNNYAGPRCAGCGRPYTPRQLRDGSWSQTCGQTACVALHARKKDNMATNKPTYFSGNNNRNTTNNMPRRRPQNAW
jgi:hypothetical protein